MKKLNAAAVTLLAAVIAATDANGNGFVKATAAPAKALVEAGLIETNESLKNDAGEIAARVTDAGREYAKSGPAETESSEEDAASDFEIETGVEMPAKTRAPIKQLYPFDALPVNGSFFVSDAKVKSGDAFKSLQSTVNGANDRHSEIVPGEFRTNRRNPEKQIPVTRPVRKFELRRDTKDGQSGARVFRTL